MVIKKELLEEMFDDWLWDKYYSEFRNRAIREVEKEVGFWNSLFASRTEQKIKDRHWKLHEELKKELNDASSEKAE